VEGHVVEGHDASKHSNVQAIKMKIHENAKLQNSVSIPLPPKKNSATHRHGSVLGKKSIGQRPVFFPKKKG
jgi:hypothetical protein